MRKFKKSFMLGLSLFLTLQLGQSSLISATATESGDEPEILNIDAEPGTSEDDIFYDVLDVSDLEYVDTFGDIDPSVSLQDTGGVVTNSIKNLDDYITSLEVIGNPTSVPHNSNVTVRFGWLIPGEIHGGSDVFTYQLPINFDIAEAATGNITKGVGGENIGTWVVDTDGLVTITYDSTYNTNGQTTVNYMEITGTAKYGSDTDGHQIKFEWKDGTKVVVVTNEGDFDVEKEARKFTPSGELSLDTAIEYTVTISSELGTLGRPFTITDTLTTTGFLDADTFTIDSSSFVLVNNQGTSISVTPTINGKTFTIENVPGLDAGGSYTLTYRVNVKQSDNLPDKEATVSNSISVQNGDTTHTDTEKITYYRVVAKDNPGFSNAEKIYRWQIYVSNGNFNIAGYTFTDTATKPIAYSDGKPRISITPMKSDGTKLTMAEEPVITISDDGKTFSFVFPDVPEATRWLIDYYSEIDDAPGSQLQISNTATLINKDNTNQWNATKSGGISVQGETSVNKSGDGKGEAYEDGTIPFNWTTSIEYTSVNKETYSHFDKISRAQTYVKTTNLDGTSWEGWDTTNFVDDHYGIASEIYNAILDSMKVTILDNGVEKEMSYTEAVADGVTFSFLFFTSLSEDLQTMVSSNDTETHIKSFKVSVTPGNSRQLLKVEYSYSTRFDLVHVSAGSHWLIQNEVGAESVFSRPQQTYDVDVPSAGSIDKQIAISGTNAWTSSDYRYDYWTRDSIGNITGKRTLTFRLLASPAEGESTLNVTDQLPEGFKFRAGSIRVGAYNGQSTGSEFTWTDQSFVEITEPSEDNGNLMTVKVTGVGTENTARDNIVVIEYKVTVDENFDLMDGVIAESTGNGYNASKTFTNTATNGDITDSLTTTIYREEKVLDKSGEQIQVNGANTSTVHYSVKINEKALDLLENNDELTLTDTMTSEELDFKLDPKSIKLYLVVDGEKGEEVNPLGVHVEQPVTEDGECTQTFSITVADKTAYILEYAVIADKREDTSSATEGTIANTIALEGYSTDETETDVKGINVRVASNHAGLQLVKVDSTNNTIFLGATFELSVYNGTDYEKVKDITITGENGFTFDYFSTTEVLEGNKLYRLVETKAPTGYRLDTTPYYFIIMGNIQDVRSGTIAITDMTISTEADAKTAAGAPSDIEIDMLAPDSGSYHEITNEVSNATGKVILEATKVLTGRDLKNEEFSFTLKEGTETVATGKNDTTGKITFTEIEYSIDQVGTHTYVMTENGGQLGGVTYDESEITVTVEVIDDGSDELKTNISYPEGGAVFTNKYEANGTATITATKTLIGKDLEADQFSFELKDSSGAVIETVKNDANGNIRFSPISYTADGTYVYTLSEVNDDQAGISYDDTVYTVNVVVTDDGIGNLTAVVDKNGSELTFENNYQAEEVSVVFLGTKTLVGKSLSDKQFSFELKDASGNVVQTVKNDKDGHITFSALVFTEAGEYVYTISEVNDNQARVTYDDTVYTLKIVVSDDGAGHLNATIQKDFTSLSFTNKYTPEQPSVPNTSDSNDFMMWTGLLILSIAGILFSTVGKKRFLGE